ncbi:hypothetical protein EBU95_03865 [bacterium]|nr:hypothetical protein [bacterium]
MVTPKKLKPINKKALKRSFLSSISRLIGVALGAGAGSLMHQMLGDGFTSYVTAFLLATVSFVLIFFAEYTRELEQ